MGCMGRGGVELDHLTSTKHDTFRADFPEGALFAYVRMCMYVYMHMCVCVNNAGLAISQTGRVPMADRECLSRIATELQLCSDLEEAAANCSRGSNCPGCHLVLGS